MLELPLLVAILAITPDDEKEPPHDPEGITLPDGFKWDEWAREPLVPDPVAFTVLPDGSLFVCESERQDRGVEDNRYSPLLAAGRSGLHQHRAATGHLREVEGQEGTRHGVVQQVRRSRASPA